MKKLEPAFFDAVKAGFTTKVERFLVNGQIDTNLPDQDGWTALFWAAQENHIKMASLLIKYGSKINSVDSRGFTPLLIAVGEGHTKMVELLLKSGADAHYECALHAMGTPLHLACAWGRLAISRRLLAAGADRNKADSLGRTPWTLALKSGNQQLVDLMTCTR